MVCFSDGISSVLSDEEVVDLARDAPDPKTAADEILAFAEELGSEDNATAIVVPLAGWGMIRGPDKTKALREYRRRQAGQHITFGFTRPTTHISVQWEVSGNDGCELSFFDFQKWKLDFAAGATR